MYHTLKQLWLSTARLKTRKPRKFFSEIFKSKFSIVAVGQNWKLRNKKTRNNISEIPEFSEFSICHFFIFQKKFFQYSKVGNSALYIYVMMFKILPCRNKIYLLRNRYVYTKTPVFFNKLLKKRFKWLRKKHAWAGASLHTMSLFIWPRTWWHEVF